MWSLPKVTASLLRVLAGNNAFEAQLGDLTEIERHEVHRILRNLVIQFQTTEQTQQRDATVLGMSSRERGNDRWLIGALLGGVGVIAGAALPWLETGGVARSVFTLARVASELGLLDRPGRKLAVYSLLGVPLLVPFALILLSLGLRKLSGLVLVVIGLLGAGSGAAGLAFGAGQLGPPVALASGVIALVTALVGAFRKFPQPALFAATQAGDVG
jgi:hypothetical protein